MVKILIFYGVAVGEQLYESGLRSSQTDLKLNTKGTTAENLKRLNAIYIFLYLIQQTNLWIEYV